MYVYCNTEVRSYNHCYSIKAISITYSECVSVALGIQHAMSGSTTFLHIISSITELINIIIRYYPTQKIKYTAKFRLCVS